MHVGTWHTAIKAATGVEAHPPGKYRTDCRRVRARRRIPDLVARQRTNATATDRVSQTLRGDVRKLLADANVEQLQRLGRALGNEALSGKLTQNDQLRDLLLAMVQERLQAIAQAQQAELKALHERGPWWRRLRRGERGITMPEPTRWGEPARLFQQAASAICAGDLGRGADLMKQASESERTHRKAVPRQVKLPAEAPASPIQSATLNEVRDGEGCTPTTAPELFQLATRIENVGQTTDNIGQIANARHAGVWWETEADEDEDKKPKEGAPRSRRLQEPAAAADLARRPVTEAALATPVQEVRVAPVEQARSPERSEPAAETPKRRAPRR